MGLTSRAAVLDGVRGKFSITESPVPDPKPGSIIIKQDLCGICGTDVHVYQGHMPVPAPAVLGHEIVGTIVALGEGVTTDSTGRPIKEGDLLGIKPGISNNDEFFGTIAHQPKLSPGFGAYGFGAPNLTKQLPLEVTGGYASYQWIVPGTKVYKMNADPVRRLDPGAAERRAARGRPGEVRDRRHRRHPGRGADRPDVPGRRPRNSARSRRS